jgi:hypothetical protein
MPRSDGRLFLRFLEGIFEANICHFERNIAKHCDPEQSVIHREYRIRFQDSKNHIHEAKFECGSPDHSETLFADSLDNTNR